MSSWVNGGEMDGVWTLKREMERRNGKRSARARARRFEFALYYFIWTHYYYYVCLNQEQKKNAHIPRHDRARWPNWCVCVRIKTDQRAFLIVFLSKDVPNQITNFNVEETNNRDAAKTHLTCVRVSCSCVCMCLRACSSHFHISKRRREKIAATAAAVSTINDKTTAFILCQFFTLLLLHLILLCFSFLFIHVLTCQRFSPTFTCISSSPRPDKKNIKKNRRTTNRNKNRSYTDTQTENVRRAHT